MKKNLTLSQREKRADKLAQRFKIMTIFLAWWAIVCGIAAIIYINWLMAGVCVFCIFAACGTTALSVRFASKAQDLMFQRFAESCKAWREAYQNTSTDKE